MSNQWVRAEVSPQGCAETLGNKNILVNSLIPWKKTAKTHVIVSFWLSRLRHRQRPLWGFLWFRSIKSRVVGSGLFGVSYSQSLPMQEVVTVRQRFRSHFQNKRRYFFMQQILDLWTSLPKGMTVAAIFFRHSKEDWANTWKRGPPLGKLDQAGGVLWAENGWRWGEDLHKRSIMFVVFLLFFRGQFLVTAAGRLLGYMSPKNLK